jgi:hypothetical protein
MILSVDYWFLSCECLGSITTEIINGVPQANSVKNEYFLSIDERKLGNKNYIYVQDV